MPDCCGLGNCLFRRAACAGSIDPAANAAVTVAERWMNSRRVRLLPCQVVLRFLRIMHPQFGKPALGCTYVLYLPFLGGLNATLEFVPFGINSEPTHGTGETDEAADADANGPAERATEPGRNDRR